jgi:hypothetical protein
LLLQIGVMTHSTPSGWPSQRGYSILHLESGWVRTTFLTLNNLIVDGNEVRSTSVEVCLSIIGVLRRRFRTPHVHVIIIHY